MDSRGCLPVRFNTMDHESRIYQLEKIVAQLQKQLKSQGILEDWIPVSQSKKILGVSSWVIKRRIRKDPEVKLNRHYRKNGNRYEINVDSWSDLIAKSS